MKKLLIYFLILVLSISFVFAGAEGFAEAKQIIDAKTPCSELSEPQLEALGDYFMEQMHPGEAHELMDRMMGGEGSESLRLVHIAMAKRVYCNDISGAANYGIMGYGMVGFGGNKNYGGMMNMMWGNSLGYGMMGNYSYGYWGFLHFLGVILLIGLIILVYMWIIKLWNENIGKRAKK